MPGKQRNPAFLYYDADVALDVAHMDRTERGCYFDLLQMYRKFRGYTTEQIGKILGTDMERCWSAIELVLEFDEQTKKYHIPWLESSLRKKAQQSEIQRERIQTYWDEKKESERLGIEKPRKPRKVNGSTVGIPRYNHGNSADIPIETETETKDRIEVDIGGMGGKEGGREDVFVVAAPLTTPLPGAMLEVYMVSFPDYPLQEVKDYTACMQLGYQIVDLNGWSWEEANGAKMPEALGKWKEIVDWIPRSSWFRTKSLSFLESNFQNLIQAKNNGNPDQTTFRSSKQAAGNGHDPTLIQTTGFGKL